MSQSIVEQYTLNHKYSIRISQGMSCKQEQIQLNNVEVKAAVRSRITIKQDYVGMFQERRSGVVEITTGEMKQLGLL